MGASRAPRVEEGPAPLHDFDDGQRDEEGRPKNRGTLLCVADLTEADKPRRWRTQSAAEVLGCAKTPS